MQNTQRKYALSLSVCCCCCGCIRFRLGLSLETYLFHLYFYGLGHASYYQRESGNVISSLWNDGIVLMQHNQPIDRPTKRSIVNFSRRAEKNERRIQKNDAHTETNLFEIKVKSFSVTFPLNHSSAGCFFSLFFSCVLIYQNE